MISFEKGMFFFLVSISYTFSMYSYFRTGHFGVELGVVREPGAEESGRMYPNRPEPEGDFLMR